MVATQRWDAQYPMPPELVMVIHESHPQCKLQARFAHTQRLLSFIERLTGMEKFHALRMDQWSLPRHAFRILCSCQDLAELVIENKVGWNVNDDWEDNKRLRLRSFEIMGQASKHPGNLRNLNLLSPLLTREKRSGTV